MRALEIQSEKYQPTGSISADGVRNQLGRPRIDRLTLLVREAVQNSWDARLSEDGPVEFGLAGLAVSPEARRLLTDTIFRRPAEGIPLRDEFKKERLALLAVYDRGTVGLSGPTRADAPVAQGVAPNFVNLLRNVGHPPARLRGGGTYGFGKTALFLASNVRTIIVHSQIKSGRRTEQRFIAAALGSEFSRRTMLNHQRFTGRHWWGRTGKGGIVEPVLGRDAAKAAKILGLPAFDDDETGTTVAIVSPDFDERSPEEAMRLLGEAILRNFWPKMVDGAARRATMKFQLSWNGQRVSLPKPEDVPPLNGFVKAFLNLQPPAQGRPAPADRFVRTIECLKPFEQLGRLSLARFPVSPRLGSATETSDADPFTGPSHHVALLRGPHFVVRYIEGPAVPFDQAEYAGVFLASDAAEPAFARSEPPTHDDWVPDALEDRHERTFVRVAIRRIREVMDEFSGARNIPDSEASGLPLGEFSDMLGGLIPVVRGSGASILSPAPARDASGTAAGNLGVKPGRYSGPPARISLRDERLELVGGTPALIVPFDVQRLAQRPVTVSAKVAVVLEEGGFETDPPDGADVPRVLRWIDGRGKMVGAGDRLTIPADLSGTWAVAVSVPRDASVGVELSVEHES